MLAYCYDARLELVSCREHNKVNLVEAERISIRD